MTTGYPPFELAWCEFGVHFVRQEFDVNAPVQYASSLASGRGLGIVKRRDHSAPAGMAVSRPRGLWKKSSGVADSAYALRIGSGWTHSPIVPPTAAG